MYDRGTVLEYRQRDAAEQARALPANIELDVILQEVVHSV
jgi:hypothetical protein